MVSGATGEELAAEIFIGPVYYQRLRHMVSDKFQVSICTMGKIQSSPLSINTFSPLTFNNLCCPSKLEGQHSNSKLMSDKLSQV